MGNTVRREPVNFDIPASPNYKFLNITNFRGLDVSSNPFELATNTASDCLNVYVDETNTLTTRPRLCKKEFKNANGEFIVPLGGTCIGVYNLHNGYLLHHIIDDKPIMRLFVDGVLKDPVGGDIPATHCTHFEHGEDIYLLTGEDYLVIKDNMISKVEGYIPNKSITTLKGEEIEDEPLNILSDEYTTRYAWDGISKPPVNIFSTDVENTYYKSHSLDIPESPSSGFSKLLGIFKDNTYMYEVWDPRLGDPKVYYVQCDEDFENKNVIELNIQPEELCFGRDTKAFWYRHMRDDTIYYCKILDDGTLEQTNTNYATSGTMAAVSDNNLRLLLKGDNDGNYTVLKMDKDVFSYENITQSMTLNIGYWSSHAIVQTAGSYHYYVTEGGGVQGQHIPKVYVAKESANETLEFSVFIDLTQYYPNNNNKYISIMNAKDASTLCILTSEYTFLVRDYFIENLEILNLSLGYDGGVSNDLSYAYSFISIGANKYNLKIFPRLSNLTSYISYVTIANHRHEPRNLSAEFSTIIDLHGLIAPINRDEVLRWTDYDDASLIKHHTLGTENETTRLDKLSQLITTTIMSRFDNNYWFAKDNKYFRTANNDPTYFPITEYSELGDSNESITGFNIANDTTLLVYKTDRLYLIQPYTSSLDTREYAITESKNTVGNTAVGAPIVTTLTEIPLQINYDGIYGLSQLQNVSAVERIADLMSEPINDRWLNEDDKVIRKAKTLNRLYWTYIILPYTKENSVDSRDVTKIYLLDNRTNSWYYWELPIKLLEAFAKDNRAEFVDTDGNIYYLTTTDIKNSGFDTQLVTEYYDDGKKLINWFWQSQILPMGTMNYAKRLVNTTFILTDTDTQDGYGLKYNFKVFRKLASSTPEKEINDELNLVRSTTKKTNISKFGFIQLKISNITEESQGTEAEKAYRNNKLRLVGLGLKYVLLEGLIR